MTSDHNDVTSWFVVLLGTIALLFVFDFARSWWHWYHARQLQRDRELPDYHDNHFDLRRER